MQINTYNASTYIDRRNKLMHHLGKGKVLLLGNRESSVNFKDNWYPFRQDSTFLYYIGLGIPDIDALIDVDSGETILFADELTINDIIWTGPLPSFRDLGKDVGIHKVLPTSKLQSYANGHSLYLPPYRPDHILRLSNLLGLSVNEINGGISEPLIEGIINQRNVKSAEEIESLHEAATLTSRMHLEVMSNAKPDMHEYELVARAQAFGGKNHSRFSFLPICTVRGHVLHNHSYNGQLKKGELLLFDGGLESKMQYAGDMTRTFPVGDKFTDLQKEFYHIVLNMQHKSVELSVSGTRNLDVHMAAAKTLVEGMKALGFMKGDIDEAVAAGAHTLFFQHGLGHMMGLDVHDMENLDEAKVGYGNELKKSTDFGLKSLRLGRTLQEGFVITIEPGLYIIPELIAQFQAQGKYLDFINYNEVEKIGDFGGIRIEDDYVIKETGCELLGEPLIKDVADIEEARRIANQ